MSAQIHTWNAAGRPPHPCESENILSRCSICSSEITEGVKVSDIETPSMSDHSSIFRFGDHVCNACAWLFSLGRGKPGNYIAIDGKFEYVVISQNSVVENKRPWSDVFIDIANLNPDTVVTGVMTTNVKPRLWHKARLATIGNFGLYIHDLEHDISGWVEFDLIDCIKLMELMNEALSYGFSKNNIYYGLANNYEKFKRNPEKTIELERMIGESRNCTHFIPALIASGIDKGA